MPRHPLRSHLHAHSLLEGHAHVDLPSLPPAHPLHGIPTPPYCPLTPVSCFQSVMNMMHVISIPYALMKVNPLSWIQKVCQYKGALGGCRWVSTHLTIQAVTHCTCFSFSKSGLCQIPGHALGFGGSQGSERHQPLLSPDADSGRWRKPL